MAARYRLHTDWPSTSLDRSILEAKMKQFVTAGTLAVALAVGGTALAQQPPPPPAKTPATTAKPADQAEKPAAKPRAKRAAASAEDKAAAAHTAPKQQPGTAPDPAAPEGAMVLATVRLPKSVKADGKDLPAGSYQVRLTPEEAKPDAKGSTEKLERWVEFVKAGKVVGREVVSIVPATEAKLVQKDTPPPSGGSKVETLKGGDYVRVWINKGGNYYLVHLTNG
jgi:hypothetical protein